MNKRIIDVGNLEIGSNKIVLIAGPCAIESEEELVLDTKDLKKVDVYRGGAFKSRTSPYSFSGLGQKGIEILNKRRHHTGWRKKHAKLWTPQSSWQNK